MAKVGRPIGKRHQEDVRNKIRASQLINRLENHVLGEVDMETTQVTAALGLLKKCVPDLTSTTISGDPENPLLIALAGVSDLRDKLRGSVR